MKFAVHESSQSNHRRVTRVEPRPADQEGEMVPGTSMTPNQTSNPASFVVIGNCFLVPFSESIKARLSRITVLLVPLGALFYTTHAQRSDISRKCFSLPNFKPGIPNFNHRLKSRINVDCLHSIVSQKEVDFRLEEI